MGTRQIPYRVEDGKGNLVEQGTYTITTTPEQDNDETIRAQAQAALTANRTFINAAKPTTAAAQASQAYDQAVKCSRQNNGIIRLLLGLLDATD